MDCFEAIKHCCLPSPNQVLFVSKVCLVTKLKVEAKQFEEERSVLTYLGKRTQQTFILMISSLYVAGVGASAKSAPSMWCPCLGQSYLFVLLCRHEDTVASWSRRQQCSSIARQ